MSPGESIAGRIGTAIMAADAVVFVISKDTSQSSWVGSEIALAVARKAGGDHVRVIPVLIDRAAELPFFLRDIQYVDMTHADAVPESPEKLIASLRRL